MVKCLSLGNLPVLGAGGLCQHPLAGGLATHFSPLVLLSTAGNLGSGYRWVSVPTPLVS